MPTVVTNHEVRRREMLPVPKLLKQERTKAENLQALNSARPRRSLRLCGGFVLIRGPDNTIHRRDAENAEDSAEV